jgi:steroid delta-isomerase-like uncharacterized protein
MAETVLGTTADTIDEEVARERVARFLRAWNSHDPEQLLALATPDVRWQDPYIHREGVLHGRDALRGWLRSVWRAIPDMEFSLVGEPFVALDGRQLAAQWIGRGRNTGPLDPPGFAPTGAAVEMQGVDVHRYRGGLLAEVVTITDVTAVARQIGAAPAPGTLGERLGVRVQRLAAARARRRS